MIWNSTVLMTAVDLLMVGLAITLVVAFVRHSRAAARLGGALGLRLILCGLLVVTSFYLLDLTAMHGVSALYGHTLAMELMTDLHLNWAWLSNLLSVGLMASGFLILLTRVAPRANQDIEELEQRVAARNESLRLAHDRLVQEHARTMESRQRLELACEAAEVGVWDEVDPTRVGCRAIWGSDRYRELLGLTSESISREQLDWRTRLHPRDRKKVLDSLARCLDRCDRFEVECRLRCTAGEYRWFLLCGQARCHDEQGAARMAGTLQDITLKKQTEDRMRELELAIENAMTGVSRLNAEGIFVEVRKSYGDMLGYANPLDLVGQSWEVTVVEEDHDAGRESYLAMLEDGVAKARVRALRADGSEFVKEVLLVRIDNEEKEHVGHYCFMRDVTTEQTLTEQLTHQAQHDTLTNLFNRAEFEARLEQAIRSANSEAREHALLYLDLDQFKVVNDTCGHMAGDQLLRELAQRLDDRVRRHDTLARLGGDEFGVLLENCTQDQALRLANDLRDTVADFTFTWDGKTFPLGVSIGVVSIGHGTSGNLSDALKDADAACYAAKDAGRNRVHCYRPDDEHLAARQGEMQWIEKINSALIEDRLALYRQPITGATSAGSAHNRYEVLVRLVEPSGRVVPPGAFLPAAERYGVISRIDRWVVQRAVEWLCAPQSHESVALCHINVSGPSLAEQEFLDYVLEVLDASGVDAKRICFEITETAAVSNIANARRFIGACRLRGCQFALDDFGSGLSSFGYLKNLSVDVVKIDGQFVRDMLKDPVDLAMVRAIHDVARVMGISSIAEFVESEEVLVALQGLGIDFVQGFYIGRPEPLEGSEPTAGEIRAAAGRGKVTPIHG